MSRARTGPSCPGDARRAVAPAEAEAAVSAVRSERGLAARPSVRLVLGPRALGRGLARTGPAASSVAGALGAGREDRASSGFVPGLRRREPRPFRIRNADGRRRLKRSAARGASRSFRHAAVRSLGAAPWDV